MPQIELLSRKTIDKIAAGEVVERPSSVVKELVENAIDAGANAITVEVKDGGVSLIRVTDNGCGIAQDQIKLAFLRHSTSKIRSAEDLLSVTSLGFRGEALSSIAAVSQVELITRTPEELIGVRYVIEGSKEISCEEIGAPEGTTFLVRNLFFNTPARRKFLKSAQTEAGYIQDLMHRMILSHPSISFQFLLNGQVKLQSSGNDNCKDILYRIYGREITGALLELEEENELFAVRGYLGKPQISRGNRNFETYFINGRYIRSNLIAKATEEAYKPYLMQHQFPFVVLYFTIDSGLFDVNVHPSKMELRFLKQQQIFEKLVFCIQNCLRQRELIPEVPIETRKEQPAVPKEAPRPEPFETKRLKKLDDIRQSVAKDSPYEPKYAYRSQTKEAAFINEAKPGETPVAEETITYAQTDFLDGNSMKNHRLIGQVFETYWLVEFDGKLYIIDQHAAHEKVLYERMIKQLARKENTSQRISPPVILTLSLLEEETLKKYLPQLEKLGYDIEHFGGNEYAVSAVPGNMFRLDTTALLLEILDELSGLSAGTPDMILERVASLSCKAAVKGNQRMSFSEAEHLIAELLTLKNPYYCPHGRPTIIAMTKYELEKKFKRIV